MQLPDLDIQQYNYSLPDEYIAQHPVSRRGQSKLLLAQETPFSITDFSKLKDYIPENSLLIFNETMVIPARLIFAKATGARIEIFLLHPLDSPDFQTALGATQSSRWQVLIGNASKWKDGALSIDFDLPGQGPGKLVAERISADSVLFSWSPEEIHFSEILDHLARVPLPPYIRRDSAPEDRDRYQTVFARHKGSVAAPTAGLHFTDQQLTELSAAGIKQVALTLHVGLGTFRPVKDSISNHEMHNEPIHISAQQLQTLSENTGRPWVVVGTTTLRALESLYVFAEKTAAGKCNPSFEFAIEQWDKWHSANQMSRRDAFNMLAQLAAKNPQGLSGNTSLCIVKGRPVQSADYLITNFHQPKSTLLMLVDAFASEDWKAAYAYALDHNMRFLSYGDACLFKNKTGQGC